MTNNKMKNNSTGEETAGEKEQDALIPDETAEETALIEETGWNKIERLESELSEKTKETAALYDRLLRLTADTENYKKRVEKEKGESIALANESLITEILPVLDNLERAFYHANDGTGNKDSLHEGVQLTLEQFRATLKKFGITEVKSVGEKFDPVLHHAISHDDADGFEPGTVVKEFQKGYFLKGKLIRPSMVAVSKD